MGDSFTPYQISFTLTLNHSQHSDYPPLPHNARLTLKDSILPVGGRKDGLSPVFVPAGTNIEFQAFALHRRKDLWGENAEERRPEQREKEVSKSWVRSVPAIIPFPSRLLSPKIPHSRHSY